MDWTSRIFLVIAALSLLSLPSGTEADGPAVFGAWTNTERDGSRATIERAVLEGTESMAPVRQRIARRRLLAANPPVDRIELNRSDDAIEVRYQPGRPGAFEYSSPEGTPRINRGPDGKDARVTNRLDGDRRILQH